MSHAPRNKNRGNTDFRRACRFLLPYRMIVVFSILAAFFVGAATTSGITVMLPVLQILLNGDTFHGWMDRYTAEKRLGVTLSDDLDKPCILYVKDGGAAKRTLKQGEFLPPVHELADPTKAQVITRSGGQEITLTIPPVPFYLTIGSKIASRIPDHPLKAVGIMLGVILGLTILSNVVRFFQEYNSDKATIGAINDMRRRLYDHILHLPLGFFNLKGTSDVTSRLVADTQGLQEGFKILFGQTLPEIIKATMALSLAVLINWQLTLVIICFAPIMGVTLKKLGKKMRRASRAAMQNSSSMLGQIEATLGGVRVVKGAVAERFERRRYMGIMGLLRLEQLKMARYEAYSTPAMETIGVAAVCLIVFYATYLVTIVHSLKPNDLILMVVCLGVIAESLRRVSKINNIVQRCNAAAGRVFEVLDVPIERRRTIEKPPLAGEQSVKLPPIQREVRFENLTFTYPGGQQPAICDVNLTVPKGKCVAVVGRNGSGKTTLLALLPRFYDPQHGRVLIDGVDVRQATLRSLRRQISIVTQETIVFPGTIAQNIAYGLPLAKRAEIINAAQRAFAHDFIMEKPKGYDTSLDGLGAQLSGGQKQRLCIARAILRQAPILILDEATSQVDAESEHLIQQAIESLMHQRTTFVIAHRFSTILSADEIVVMDKGRIVATGCHEELLKSCETYQQLYERQLLKTA